VRRCGRGPNPLVCAGEAGRLARTPHGSALPHDYATEGIDRKCCAAGALGVPGMGGAVMVIPGLCGCHRRVRHERLLSEDSSGQLASSRTG
jgi:hypothetical protein